MSVIDRVVSAVVEAGGVVHRDALRGLGLSDSALRDAVRSGLVLRIRGSWFAMPDAPADLQRAAAVGGRLTCVSATKKHGLWTPSHTEGHIAVPANRSHYDGARLKLHWGVGPVPVHRGQLVDPLLNVLFHVARCMSLREALTVWESAVRRGRVSRQLLDEVRWGSAASVVARILTVLSVLSDSGIETHFVDRLRPFGLPLRQQVVLRGRPVDALIGDRLVIQIDGFEYHSDAGQRRSDIRHDAQLALLGYTVLRFDYMQIMFDWDYVEATVLSAIAQGRHLAA